MMHVHAIQFVNELAELIGRDPKTIRGVDRALSEAGLRRMSAGKKFPDVTLEEAVMLLFALLSGYPATRAAAGAIKLANFRFSVKGYQNRPSDLATALNVSMVRLAKMNLLEVVCRLCIRFARGSVDPKVSGLKLEVFDGDLAAFYVASSGTTDLAEIYFKGDGPIPEGEGFSETRSANPILFKWIGQKAMIPK